jgi:hypothetical protein
VSFSISGVAAPVIAVSASTSASAALTDSTVLLWLLVLQRRCLLLSTPSSLSPLLLAILFEVLRGSS